MKSKPKRLTNSKDVANKLRAADLDIDDVSDDSEDDRVIGRAFWRSLLVVFGFVGLAGGIYILNMASPKVPRLSESATKAPLVRESFAVQSLPSIPLVDESESSNVVFNHFNGKEGDRLLPETMGGGCGFLDFDNDGDQDILLVNSSPWPWAKQKPEKDVTMALFENDGTGKYTNVTKAFGLEVQLYGMGPAFGDYDGDGWTDLFVTGVGQNRLFHNEQGKGFTDVTDQFGVAGRTNDWSCPAMWFDYDRDGRLDLLVGHYVEWSRELDLRQGFTLTGLGRAYGPPTAFGGTYLTLYHNEGNSFRDVSKEAGLEIQNPATKVPVAKSLALLLTDANFDGWPDVVVSNDTVQNFLLINNRDGTFDEQGIVSGMGLDRNGVATGAMGIDCAHFRNDENLAVAIGNFANEPSSLYLSHAGKPVFSDKSNSTGFGPQTKRLLTFGLVFADMDLDGRQDLVCSNGHLEEEISKVQPNQRYKQPPQLFWNAGRNDQASDELVPLLEPQTGATFQAPLVGRGLAYADIDSDGDLDLLMAANGDRAKLFRNELKLGNRWLRIKLKGTTSNTEAIGASIQIPYGDQIMSRYVSPTRSYLSQVELVATFGFGPESNTIGLADPTEIHIVWPNGQSQSEPIDGLNKVLTITQKQK